MGAVTRQSAYPPTGEASRTSAMRKRREQLNISTPLIYFPTTTAAAASPQGGRRGAASQKRSPTGQDVEMSKCISDSRRARHRAPPHRAPSACRTAGCSTDFFQAASPLVCVLLLAVSSNLWLKYTLNSVPLFIHRSYMSVVIYPQHAYDGGGYVGGSTCHLPR